MNHANNRTRYTLDDILKHTFYQIPKFLFEGEFEELNNDARVLYSILKDRHELSTINQWLNENNEIYIIFSREEMCKKLKLSKKTIIKAMNTLKQFNLIEEERVGLGNANKIYLLTAETLINPQKCKTYTYESGRHSTQEVQDLHFPSINKTYDIKTESKSTSHAPSKNNENIDCSTNDNDFDNSENSYSKYDYIKTKALIHKNICYNHFLKHKDNPGSVDIRLVDELVNCMLDVICTAGQTVKINQENKDRQLVIEKYLTINVGDIQHIISKYEEQRSKITHVNSYLKTMLYTVKQENNFYYTNAVRADGFV